MSGSEPTNTEWQDGQRVMNGKMDGNGLAQSRVAYSTEIWKEELSKTTSTTQGN